MNDDLEALERELSRLKPIAPSPALRDRIESRLIESSRRFRRWWIGGAAAAVAAGVALVVLPLRRPAPQVSKPIAWVSPPLKADEAEVCSLAALNRAANRSPQALEAMLASESIRRQARSPSKVLRAFDRSVEFKDLNIGGDL